ncbi:universal stress protein [Cupriavidus sp. Marseille-Q8015]
MFGKILVALDGSHCARNALRTAIDLALVHGSHVDAVYVVDDSEPLLDVAFIRRDDLLRSIADYGRGVLAEATHMLDRKGVAHDTLLIRTPIRKGEIGPTLVDQAERSHADLIVMGTHGRRSFYRLFMGSVSQAVVSASRVPVLLVHDADGNR